MENYTEALSWIHSRLKHGVNLGLERMEWMLEKLGNPERKLTVIHVGGTNGKGSTVTFLRSMLQEAGYETGTFTSPYIEEFNERMSINGKPIQDADIVELVNAVKPYAEELETKDMGAPTEFEVITAMAIYYFAEVRPVDLVVLEVGLGGRYDSTNVVDPIAAIITNIGMDHMNVLGNSIEKIAFEKAGIIKDGVPLFTAVKQPGALEVIKKEAQAKNAIVYELGKSFAFNDHVSLANSEVFTFEQSDMRLEQAEIHMLGTHQVENASTALACLAYLNQSAVISISANAMRKGLAKAYWPGRMEILHHHPVILLDGAHNPEGLYALAAATEKRYKEKKVKLVFAALADKDLSTMMPIISQIGQELYLTEFNFPRAASIEVLQKAGNFGRASFHKDWRTLIIDLVTTLEEDEVLAVTGSLYFLAMVKPFIKETLKSIK